MQFQKPALVQEQRLKMNPQLYQSIQLMAMPLQDLRLRIQQEIEANPALEVVEDAQMLSLDEVDSKQTEEYDYFENTSDPGFTAGGYDDEAGDAKRRFMEGALSRPESLHEHLLWQLRLQPISPQSFAVGEALINNLDANGFHREPVEVVVPEQHHALIEPMVSMIRRFDPVGTCVCDYRESLVVQAELAEDMHEAAIPIIRDFLDLLERGKYADIARKLKIDEQQVLEALEAIRRLTPFPGREFSSDSPTYVVPDLMVKLREGQFVLIVNDEEIPVLGINSFFTEMSGNREAGQEKTVKRFVNQSVKDARWFINSIHQRNQTLMNVARAIVEFQRDFFLRGPKGLVPLTLKDIAAEVGVHEATVSRITSSKYIQTEWGIFELKYFFSNSISGAGSTGSRYSKEAVKQIVKEILEDEGRAEKHLSDQRISDLLSKRGINIARRTVTKYRKELDISSSYER
ncbi:MAG: RNA polymerase sigma-54 factor [Spirochaetaceae bacterium]|nr:MAG: RNA polymerase sigma-54 factor [Spirochaetaceae bacterium]